MDKVINPETGRTISTQGSLYKKLVKEGKIKPVTTVKTAKKLTLTEIQNLAKDKKIFIVVLWAEWCGFCNELKQQISFKDKDYIIFRESKTIDNNLTNYYPRILYYKNGKKQEDLDSDELLDFLN